MEPNRETTIRKAEKDGWRLEPQTRVVPVPVPVPVPDPVLSSYGTAVLRGTIATLEEALDAGAFDGELSLLLDAERNGKARVGAIESIEQRISVTG